MATLRELIRDGDQIVSAYMISKDAAAIQVDYPPWAENVETLFDSERDPLAKAGFRNAPSLLAHPAWMTCEGALYWQKLKGQLEVLTAIATERQLAWSATVISVISLIIGLASLAMGIAVYFEP
jgi:hypothetical protein